jgi:hypothetical protein
LVELFQEPSKPWGIDNNDVCHEYGGKRNEKNKKINGQNKKRKNDPLDHVHDSNGVERLSGLIY